MLIYFNVDKGELYSRNKTITKYDKTMWKTVLNTFRENNCNKDIHAVNIYSFVYILAKSKSGNYGLYK